MSERTIVHVMRHGEVHNPDGILYERLPGFRLSANGLAMAEAVAGAFADVPLTHLRTSPLQRALETIAPFAAARPELEVVTDERLIEAGNRFAGQVFGRHHAALRKPRNWPMMLNPFRPSWGEPFVDIAARMQAAITDAALAAGPGGQAFVVSHQSPIWVARRAFTGRRPAHLPGTRTCSLASVTSFHFDGMRCAGVTYSEPAGHLLGADGNAAFSSGD